MRLERRNNCWGHLATLIETAVVSRCLVSECSVSGVILNWLHKLFPSINNFSHFFQIKQSRIINKEVGFPENQMFWPCFAVFFFTIILTNVISDFGTSFGFLQWGASSYDLDFSRIVLFHHSMRGPTDFFCSDCKIWVNLHLPGKKSEI